MRSESLRGPAILAFGALTLLACLLVYFLIESDRQQGSVVRAIRFAEQVIGDLRAVRTTLAEAEAAQRTYLMTGDTSQLRPYEQAPAAVGGLVQRLRQSFTDEPDGPDQLGRLDQLVRLLDDRMAILHQELALRQADRPPDALAPLRGEAAAQGARDTVAAMIADEQQRLDRGFDLRQRQRNYAVGIAAIGGVFAALMMLAACILAAFFARTNQSVRAALQSARDAAVSADRAKSQFLATASHDLRQPLHAMNLFISALRRRVHGEEATKLVANMASAAESMQMMFNSLLDVSKLHAGVVVPVVRDFPIEEVFARLRSAFAASADAKGLDLDIEGSPSVLRTDPVLLESILRNLISNAVRYTRQGEVTVLCRIRGELAGIEVSDTGPGIPADQIERAFEEFQRLDNSAAERGLGLGLAIVRRLARLLDLPIEIESVVGIGTSFTVHVPLAAAEPVSAQSNTNEGPPSLAGRRLLLVDDDPLVRAALAREIADWGARITVVGSADAALWALGPEPPEVAIVDRDLGEGANGLDLLVQLEAHFGHPVPAVIVTGATDAAALDELRRSGTPWLTKPLQPAVLRAKVDELLAKSREALPTG